MNAKGGINAVELQKYINTAIFPLYPDIADKPGKRVLLKVDSGPGRMNIQMLAELRLKGLYLMPGVPNTTQVTQETDQSYGQYKSIYRKNLRLLSQKRQPVRMPVILTDLALLVFGGIDRITGIRLENTFEKAFSHERNLSCWNKCGAVPLTRAPLHGPNVRQELDRDGSNDRAQLKLKDIEKWNHYYCDFLTANGYAGFQLKTYAPVRKTTPAVTVPNTKERIKAIRNAKSSGQMFYATGGQHLNSDDFFKARALAAREGEAGVLLKKKEAKLERINLDREAKSLLQEKAIDLTQATEKKFLLPDCELLCKWKDCKLKSTVAKPELVSAYIAAARPPTPEPWTQKEEDELLAAQGDDIDLKDTALGVAAKQMAAAVAENMSKLDDKTRHELLQSLAKFDSNVDHESTDRASGVI